MLYAKIQDHGTSVSEEDKWAGVSHVAWTIYINFGSPSHESLHIFFID